MFRAFVKTHGKPMILLEPLKKSFNHISFLVLLFVYFPRPFVILLARNTRTAAFALYQAQKFTRAISLVSHNYQRFERKTVEQPRCNLYIVEIAGREQQLQRSALFINCRVNLGVITAFAFSYMSLKPFFAPKPWRCTLTKVESRLNSSKSASFVSAANIFSKSPFACRRQKYL